MEQFTLEDRYLVEDGTVYLSGVQALVRMLFDRVRHDRATGASPAVFVSGYEGSPLAGYDLELGRRSVLLEKHNVVHRPGLNEELAATAVMGSQLTASVGSSAGGVTGFWYGKAPGLDRATDALRHANLAGTDPAGGAVALVGDDPNAKSSSVPCASELALADLSMPVFFPADSQDVLDFGLHAVELSRASGLWSSMKLVANVADAASTAQVRPLWTPPELALPAYRHKPSSRLLGTTLMALERSLYTERLPLAVEYVRASGINRIVARGPADRVGIVTAGKSYLDLMQALLLLGLDAEALSRHGIRILKLGVIHPLEPSIIREFADGLSEIVVVEEKRSFVEAAIKDVLYGTAGAPAVHGKTGPDGRTLCTELGELDPDAIARALAGRLSEHHEIPSVTAWRSRRRRERISVPLLTRTPYFCSGCPHNSSTKVPEGTVVGGGIGCHAMALFMEPEQVGDVVGLTQMGGEGAQWLGMEPFVEASHFVQNIGDGTFTHSGSLAVRAAVAAGVNITYKILYNATVAMTGGQDAVGGLPVERLASLLLVEGVAKVVITSDEPKRFRGVRLPDGVEVRHRDELLSTQEELAGVPGVTVLIHDQECAAEKRRKRRRGKLDTPAAKVVINERVCEGCGDCGEKSNCLSVQPVTTEFGRKTAIHQSSCNVDYSCLAGDCPSFMTVVPTGRKQRRQAGEIAAADLPEPETAGTDFSVRITGVGGTGVVTVAQILATAAVLEGRQVRTLDQTGLAQKGGAVVSDLKITAEPTSQAPKLAAGECDLYLACDVLVGADPAHLAVADPGRTTAVVSTTEVPTGKMVVDTTVSFPDAAAVRGAISENAARTVALDARALAETLFDDDQFANILQLGAAQQTGAIPLAAASLERAIELNGVAVAGNLQAFRRGRQLVADPDALHEAVTPPAVVATPAPSAAALRARALVHAEPGSELARLLDIRVPELVRYQDVRYAREYAQFVERVRVLEGDSTAVTEAVARNLHKLMAYKDEYEVARLSLDPAVLAGIEAEFGVGSRYAYRLHPPVLRALGMKRKIALGPGFRPLFVALRAARKVRGTRWDPFGKAKVRKVERELVGQYRETILAAFSAEDLDRDRLLALAELPDLIRGYEDVKLANVEAYRREQAALLSRQYSPR
ncbi:indolepyruvate ferredoxin oxidoreductase family protein [Amycolatopsis regifaucium]|uniref:2-oxoacid ferredoxin oxidoreductase n=1 Tax=Amycolatopsis regifaucium TaxID=546365 RepID=A0A154M5L8_9PSEU|nr:indolepyruvate ferredoxin oxidoreductase family protein [Amycolatopsis regifaucium]KZB79720.1 2-oxoacid ferredoxin oxidoreductase [Amycolatopsis regifaucium]OKA09965.1 2-oxoacid ferredoxin oxidoreductase [Amycolatopsis regifaucium]SFI67068.1 indolepyruvate ferredoxin oxidoreductase [Amycolatopsis regifaucium]